MIIETKFFGEIDIKDEDIIYFEQGLLAFEDTKEYVIINIENSMFKCLQSIEKKETAFIIVNPWDVDIEYEIDIDEQEFLDIDGSDLNNMAAYSIVTIYDNKITANFVGPVFINMEVKKGKQVVLCNSKYSTKHIIRYLEKKE